MAAFLEQVFGFSLALHLSLSHSQSLKQPLWEDRYSFSAAVGFTEEGASAGVS